MRKVYLIPIVFILIIVIILILAGTPIFLNLAKTKVIAAIQSTLGEDVPVHIGSLKGNLLYSVEAEDLSIADIVRVGRLKVSYTIFKLLSREVDINSVAIEGLTIDVNRIEMLVKRLQKKAQEPREKEATQFVVRMRNLSVHKSNLIGVLNQRAITLSLDVKGRLLPDVVIIERLNLKTERSTITAQGCIPIKEGGNYDVQYSFDIRADEFGIENLRGRIFGSGEVIGDVAAPKILNRTEFDLTQQENELAGSVRVAWQTPLFDSLNLEAQAGIKTLPFLRGEKQRETWNVAVSVRTKEFRCEISSTSGSATVQGTLGGDTERPVFDAYIMGKFQFAKFHPRIVGHVTYKHNRFEIKNVRVRSDEILVIVNALIDADGVPALTSDIVLSCEDLGVLNTFIKTPQPLLGQLKIVATMSGPMENPNIFSTIAFRDLEIDNEKMPRADFTVTVKNHIVSLDTGLINSVRGYVSLTGEYNLKDDVFRSHIFSDGMVIASPEIFGSDTIPISGHIAFDVNLSGSIVNPAGEGEVVLTDIVYDTLRIGNYKLMFRVADSNLTLSVLDDRESVYLDAEVALYEPFPFSAVLNLHHFDFAEYIAADTARISTRISARGDARKPSGIIGTIQIESLFVAVQQKVIRNSDSLIIDIDRGSFEIHSCVIAIQNKHLRVQGIVPLDFHRDAMNLSITAPNINVADLVALVPDAPSIKGLLHVDMNVSGTVMRPEMNGELRLENISCALPDITIDSVFSNIRFQNSRIIAEYVKGKINSGSFSINGFIVVPQGRVDTLHAVLRFNNVDLKHKDVGSIVFSGDMYAAARKDSFRVTGEVTVAKAVYDAPFNLQTIIKLLTTANRPPSEQPEIAKRLFFDIGISAPNGVKISNNVAQVDADLDLQVRGYLSKLNVYGTISTTKKGVVQYLGKKFEIVQALIEFDNPYKIDPTLDLTATHFVSTDEGDYQLSMYVSGTVEKWRLDLKSNPPIPEQDIISLLLIGQRRPTTQMVKDGKRVDFEDMAKDYATGLVKGTIEETAEKTLGVEKFTITGDLLDPKQLDIGIEKKIGKRLTFIYGTGIESWELHRIGVNFDITDNFSIFTLHDQENMNSSVDLDFHFKIK
ncbi:MAG: translocation/assembly module TamB domain-containing protein [candidate division WOR-3 bacterium]|nr:MAG: translocation/assembly module TamB domain-containing protein [candidate division WOR-3 bacterium]